MVTGGATISLRTEGSFSCWTPLPFGGIDIVLLLSVNPLSPHPRFLLFCFCFFKTWLRMGFSNLSFAQWLLFSLWTVVLSLSLSPRKTDTVTPPPPTHTHTHTHARTHARARAHTYTLTHTRTHAHTHTHSHTHARTHDTNSPPSLFLSFRDRQTDRRTDRHGDWQTQTERGRERERYYLSMFIYITVYYTYTLSLRFQSFRFFLAFQLGNTSC